MVGVSALVKKGAVNVAMWGRDANDSKQGLSTGAIYSCLYGLHQKYIGLDVLILNNGGAFATVALDGVTYTIPAGAPKSFTNHPFSDILVVSATNIDIDIDGILYDTAKDLGLISEGGLSKWQ